MFTWQLTSLYIKWLQIYSFHIHELYMVKKHMTNSEKPDFYLTTTESWSLVPDGAIPVWKPVDKRTPWVIEPTLLWGSPVGLEAEAPILPVIRSSPVQQLRCNAHGIKARNRFIACPAPRLKRVVAYIHRFVCKYTKTSKACHTTMILNNKHLMFSKEVHSQTYKKKYRTRNNWSRYTAIISKTGNGCLICCRSHNSKVTSMTCKPRIENKAAAKILNVPPWVNETTAWHSHTICKYFISLPETNTCIL